MTFFTGGYLVLATSTLAVAVKLLPLAEVLVVLACDCAFYHALRVAADEWWILSDGGLTGSTFYRVLRMVSDEWWVFSDGGLTGMIAWVFDLLFNTTLWIMWHVCPVGTLRDSNWTGPHVMVWTVACSLIEYTVVICSVLFFPLAHPATVQVRTTVRLVCLPALCVALVSLTAFFVAMEARYRRTFYARDTRRAMHRRHWNEAEGRPTANEDRALIIGLNGAGMRFVGDLASAWIVDGAAKWEQSQEATAWYTEEWRQVVRGSAHLMGSRATEALAAMRDDRQTRLLTV
jgi:small-conductance mechanosensitive channel